MLDFLINIDTELFLLLNDLHIPFFDFFMWAFSGKLIWGPMYVAILYVLYRQYGWKAASCYAIALILAVATTDQVCSQFIRPLVERLRPTHPENPISAEVHIINGYRGGAYGFPSCHAANSFALATFCILLFASQRFTVFILAWAIINSYSRLYLGVHYLGDLIFGAMIGCSISVILYIVSKKITTNLNLISYSRPCKNAEFRVKHKTYIHLHTDKIILVGCTIIIGICVYSFTSLVS